ncbi:hypothetical protein BO94DRAFT_615982 [Aspergillus sclerotioniger CBS 115572]|uniref:Uncharacterized protein n=1 Tax=Aspergillus sclerotioniger CBS 115572 TaxID=1450535 RepID=A0A317X453_9EURO|nr:hypothetical protein BO94DRAFT_615982 [Aspergillus sclerotioniger CBS 115572]PWY93125.1 hypothetical protein BO94DRAFT_615982 [Aspergillus sclerotioniger CBS 115572]
MFPSIVILFLASNVHAFNTIHTNCTLPPPGTNFATAPNTRGTLQILWSSLFTIIACTWTVLHLNVPKYAREPEKKHFKKWLNWALENYRHPIKWFLLTVIAPEISFTKYWDDQFRGRCLFYHYEDEFKEIGWTKTHLLFANMGGFALRLHPPTVEAGGSDANRGSEVPSDSQLVDDLTTVMPAENDIAPQERSGRWKRFTSMLCCAKRKPEKEQAIANDQAVIEDPTKKFENAFFLTGIEVVKLLLSTKDIKSQSVPELRNISVQEINDRSKTDILMRYLAVGQIVWVVVQILSRWVYGLAVSQLEVTVVAFAFCAVGMYIVNRGKPTGVTLPILFEYPGAREDLEEELKNTDLPTPRKGHKKWPFVKCRHCITGKTSTSSKRGTANNNTGPNTDTTRRREDEDDTRDDFTDMSMFIGSMVFGGIHLAAWDFQFPTPVEKYLWWAAALWCTVCVLAWTLIYCVLIGFLLAFMKMGTSMVDIDDTHHPLTPKTEFNVETSPSSTDRNPNQGPEMLEPSPENPPRDEESQHSRPKHDMSFSKKIIKIGVGSLCAVLLFLMVLLGILLLAFMIAYVVARLFIVVEMFRTLAFLPQGAYVATWASDIPNVG